LFASLVPYQSSNLPLEDIPALLMSLLLAGLWLAINITAIVMICLSFRAFKQAWRIGMLIGVVVFVMSLLATIISVIYLDPDAFLEQFGPPLQQQLSGGFMQVMLFIAGVMSVLFLLLAIGWHMLIYCSGVHQWQQLDRGGYLQMQRDRSASWRGIMWATLFAAIR
jgi:hypothetical protein